MNLSFLEIAVLYLVALIPAGSVFRLGFIYHDPSAFCLGGVLIIYAIFRAVVALELWWTLRK